MKYSAILFSAFIIFTGCSKKDEAPKPPFDSTNVAEDSLHKAIVAMQNTKLGSARAALDALVALPKGGPIPPHLLPAKDIAPMEHTDTTAAFAVSSASIPVKGKIIMKRKITGADTTWMMWKVEDLK